MQSSGLGRTEPVVIFRCQSDVEAELVRALLRSYGIPCSIRSDIIHGAYPLTIDGLGEVRLAVPAPLADEARAIIEAHRLGSALRTSLAKDKEGSGEEQEGEEQEDEEDEEVEGKHT